MSEVEKVAIRVIKAKVFMEYPPMGNNIALKLAEQACKLHPTDIVSLITWLKAKGRVRRYNCKLQLPTLNELNAAKRLCSYDTDFQTLIKAADTYSEAAYIHKLQYNYDTSKTYYNMSSKLLL